MKRRRFLSSMAMIITVAALSTEALLSSCNSKVKEEGFTQDTITLLDEIGETIIPATSDSPGAKAARIGQFMKAYVTDCYTGEEQKTFWEGINQIKEVSQSKFKNEFTRLNISQKRNVISALMKEPRKANPGNQEKGTENAIQTGKGAENRKTRGKPQFYPMIQSLTVFGYFTSEPGATKALRYIQTPGSYRGEVPYHKGDKAWAT